jgi:hypothetical protein
MPFNVAPVLCMWALSVLLPKNCYLIFVESYFVRQQFIETFFPEKNRGRQAEICPEIPATTVLGLVFARLLSLLFTPETGAFPTEVAAPSVECNVRVRAPLCRCPLRQVCARRGCLLCTQT